VKLDRDDVVLEDRYVLTRPPLFALVALVLLIAAAAWVFASRSGTDPSARNPSTSDATQTIEPSPTSAPATSAPATSAPVAAAPVPAPAASTTVTPVATTTSPPVAPTVAAGTPTPRPAIAAATTGVATTTAAPAPMPPPEPGTIEADEAVAFVLSYYDQVGAGEYEATWSQLSEEFRASRNLSFESYTRFWRNTSIELSELQYRPGPGADEARVRFAARYTTGGGVIDETDELTLRHEDGRLVITEQRIVS
jgi:hypothetical protein